MIRPPERLKAVAGRLAALLQTDEGSRFLKLVTQLAEPGPDTSPAGSAVAAAPPATDEEAAPARVGIWRSKTIDGEQVFVREQTGEPWHLWAHVPRIPSKRNRRRVVLVGESVARGYLYDPHFNPASALRDILRAVCGPDAIEVVDLARTDLGLAQLQRLIQESLALAPDVLLVFAGNNWFSELNFNAEEASEVAAILRAGGSWAGVRDYVESCLRSRVELFLETLGGAAESWGVPVVFLLPEFNLADWRTETDAPFLLDSDTTALWCRMREEAGRRLAEGNWEEAETLGRKLIELDGCTTPAGPNVLAEVRLRQGKADEAGKFLETARDVSVCWPFAKSPRCFSAVQQTVRGKAAFHGIRLVDLPRGFAEHLGGDLPGRRLFLDYCHLSVEGIRVAMSLAAEALLPLLRYPARPWTELGRADLGVSPKVAGEAHFLAAVHNANWGQRREIIHHHCREAVRLYPEVTRMMKLFLDFNTRRAPSCLCRSFDELCYLQNPAAINLLFNDSAEKKFLNTALMTELADALEGAGVQGRSFVEALLRKEHAVGPRGVSLLDRAYSTVSFVSTITDTRPGFYKAPTTSSHFRLVCGDTSHAVTFLLSLRVRGAAAGQVVSVWVNGVRVYELAATESWTTATFSAPATLLHPGLNHIEIRWPIPRWSCEEWKNRVAERFEAGEASDVVPIFGEIHSFRVSLAPHGEPQPTGRIPQASTYEEGFL